MHLVSTKCIVFLHSIMKTLYLVRHAKSSWKNPGLRDHDRPLNKRGMRDAPSMGMWMAEKREIPQYILSSTALRALNTTKLISKSWNITNDKIHSTSQLFHATPYNIINIIHEIPDIFHSAMIIAHNPGLTDLTNMLTKSRIQNIPTCGIVKIQFDMETWGSVHSGNGELLFFEYPKNLIL